METRKQDWSSSFSKVSHSDLDPKDSDEKSELTCDQCDHNSGSRHALRSHNISKHKISQTDGRNYITGMKEKEKEEENEDEKEEEEDEKWVRCEKCGEVPSNTC